MPKVSIIVPVYNVEKYLRKCLDSLVNQTMQDIEIILVNDASPDGSDVIMRVSAELSENHKMYFLKRKCPSRWGKKPWAGNCSGGLCGICG